MSIDKQALLAGVRPLFGGRLQPGQATGLGAIVDAWDAKMPSADIRWLAYMLATAYHETARSMQPVREAFWLSEDWRRKHLSYYPYYGRGYVQLTWSTNYARAGAYVGADLVSTPDLALRPDFAADVMQVGMTEGWFRRDRHGRPHTLGRYFGQGVDDPEAAREIINGPEWKTVGGRKVLLATVIAGYHAAFLQALVGHPAAVSDVAFDLPLVDLSSPPSLELSLPSIDLDARFGGWADIASAASAPPSADRSEILAMTASIVAGYVANNPMAPEAVPQLLSSVHATLRRLEDGIPEVAGVGADPAGPAAAEAITRPPATESTTDVAKPRKSSGQGRRGRKDTTARTDAV